MMETFLLVRERIKKIYARYTMPVTMGLRFLMTFAGLLCVNHLVSYGRFSGILFPFTIAVISSMVSSGTTILISALWILLNLSGMSYEVAAVSGIVMLILCCFNYAVRPRAAWVMFLLPVLFVLRMPYLAALILGLIGTVTEIFPVIYATILFYFFDFLGNNSALFSSSSSLNSLQKVTECVSGLTGNKEMMLMAGVLSLMLVVTWIIGRIRVDYAKQIALACGLAVGLLATFGGIYALQLKLSLLPIILGMIGSGFFGWLFLIVILPLDYPRTEEVQFEDDDYYYYVKAIPKMAISKPEKQVKKLNIRKELENTSAIPDLSDVPVGSSTQVFEPVEDAVAETTQEPVTEEPVQSEPAGKE